MTRRLTRQLTSRGRLFESFGQLCKKNLKASPPSPRICGGQGPAARPPSPSRCSESPAQVGMPVCARAGRKITRTWHACEAVTRWHTPVTAFMAALDSGRDSRPECRHGRISGRVTGLSGAPRTQALSQAPSPECRRSPPPPLLWARAERPAAGGPTTGPTRPGLAAGAAALRVAWHAARPASRLASGAAQSDPSPCR